MGRKKIVIIVPWIVNPSWLPKGLSFAVPDFGVTNSPEGGPRTEENVEFFSCNGATAYSHGCKPVENITHKN